jgi:hypothetical protein
VELPVRMIFESEHGIAISFPNNVTEDLPLTHVEGNQYRIDASSFLAEPKVFYGDVIEINPTGEKTADFVAIVKRSGLKVSCRLIGKNIIESASLQNMLDKIVQLGGNWERTFGGVLIVHLPATVDWDVNKEITIDPEH